MSNISLSESSNQKSRITNVLFWLFVTVFGLTAVFALVGLAIVFVSPERAETYPQFNRLVWALWGVILVEVAGGIFALWKNAFGLSSNEEITTAKNIVGEIIDGLESNGDISEDKAEALRKEYSKTIGAIPESNVMAIPTPR